MIHRFSSYDNQVTLQTNKTLLAGIAQIFGFWLCDIIIRTPGQYDEGLARSLQMRDTLQATTLESVRALYG